MTDTQTADGLYTERGLRPVTLTSGLPGPEEPVRRIIHIVAAFYRLHTSQITGVRREKQIIRARHVAMYLAARLTGKSRCRLSQWFNREDTAVSHGTRKITANRETDPALAEELLQLELQIRIQTGMEAGCDE